MPEESGSTDESWLAVAPLAIVPAAVALGLLLPGPLDPGLPLETAPAPIWIALIVAGIAPGATIVLARRILRENAIRARVLRMSAGAALALTWIAALAAVALGPLILVHGGVVRILGVLAIVGLSVAAAAAIVMPRRRAAWGAVIAEVVIVLAVFLFAGKPRTPDEELRSAMQIAPAWGETNLATIALRRIAHPRGDPDYEQRLLEKSDHLAAFTSNGSFALPAYRRWSDDATLIRGWLTIKLSQSPRMEGPDRVQVVTMGLTRYLEFARDPSASLERFTMNSTMGARAMMETGDIRAPEPVRTRIWVAWEALRIFGLLPEDTPEQQQAEETVRAIYRDEHLDLEEPSGNIFFGTFTFRRTRLVEKGDAQAFLAYFDALANDATLPAGERKAFEHESMFVRAHPEDGYKGVMALLQARYADDPKTALQAVVTKWPDSSVAAEAQKDLMTLAGAPPPPSAGANP